MKIKTLLFLIILILLTSIVFAETYTSDPSRIGIGAKPLSLGKAVTALADTPTSIFTNPAGLAASQNLSFTSMNGKLINDVDYLTLGISYPIGPGVLGIGFINAGTNDIAVTLVTGNGTSASISTTGNTNYFSSVLTASYAVNLKPVFFLNNYSVGLNLKIFSQGFSNTSSLEGGTGTGLDLDLGSQWQPATWLNLGINCRNFLPASMGGKFTWANGTSEQIPMTINLGSAITVIGNTGLYNIGKHKLTLLIDSEMSYLEIKPGIWHLGAEWQPLTLLAIRAGIDQNISATENDTATVENNLSAGIGLTYSGFIFDYAYHRFGELNMTTSHFFSLGFEF